MTCPHRNLDTLGNGYVDTDVRADFVRCLDCGAYLTLTTWLACTDAERSTELTPMTTTDITKYYSQECESGIAEECDTDVQPYAQGYLKPLLLCGACRAIQAKKDEDGPQNDRHLEMAGWGDDDPSFRAAMQNAGRAHLLRP